jgi:hypothetical protein
LSENARAVNDTAALWILGCEPEGPEARKTNRCSAHRTGLECHPQGAIVQSRGAEFRCGSADRHHLGVSGWIVGSPHRVLRFGDYAVCEGHHSANRHFATRSSFSCKVERSAHRLG